MALNGVKLKQDEPPKTSTDNRYHAIHTKYSSKEYYRVAETPCVDL